ncbi:MAG: transglutaminase domain-containing protein [Bacteroidales bacterium]
MKKILFIAFIVSTLAVTAQEKHFMTDAGYRKQTMLMFEKQKQLASKRDAPLFAVFNQNLSLEESEALSFLYAYMPLSDLADYSGDFYLDQIKASFEARDAFSWGKTIPEMIFRHFVLPCRVNNENMDTARIVFLKELKSRISHLSMKEAALEVNHWCHEKVAYQGCDARTSGPLSTIKNALGRCGEESTFTVAALRSVGIPARQCYTPRWAHSDDNHAWVEVWVDGKWHFMGACEPEPDLDLGWFAAPSKRCMMVNTTVFGNYPGDEEVLQKDERFTKINLLANYAPVKTIYVKVTNKSKQPVENASVEFQLYNYAEFYPLAVKKTTASGLASLKTGFGDLLIWASKADVFGFVKLTVENTDTITVILDKKPGMDYALEMDLCPPVPRDLDVKVSEQAREINNNRLKYEDSIRKAYENTFIDSISAENTARINGLDVEKTKIIVQKSRGNGREIQGFLNKTKPAYKYLCLPLLEAISDKDLHDVTAEVLNDHLYNSIRSDKYDMGMNANYIINPRIGDEMLKAYKSFIQSLFSAKKDMKANEIADWIKTNIKIDNTANYYRLPITPKGSIDLGVSDATSRDILFVAICRSMGIPSRLEPASKLPQYYDWNGWNNQVFEQSDKKPASKSTIVLKNDAGSGLLHPEYSTHYSIEKFKDGKYHTLDYEMDHRLKTFPCQLNVEAGDYLLVCGNRQQNGSVLASLRFFQLKPNQSMDLPIQLRKSKQANKVLGKIKENIEFENYKTHNSFNYKQLKDNYTVFIWLDAGKEPTKHALQDISKLRTNFEKWGGNILLLLPKNYNKTFDYQLISEMPSQSMLVLDKTDLMKEIETISLSKFADNLPLIVVVNEKAEIIYLSNGYKIGSGEQLLKLF